MEYIDDNDRIDALRLVDSGEISFYVPTSGLNGEGLLRASARAGLDLLALRVPTTIEISEEGVLINLD